MRTMAEIKTYDDVRDLAIAVIEVCIQELAWDETDQLEREWYPFELQDAITEMLCERFGIEED